LPRFGSSITFYRIFRIREREKGGKNFEDACLPAQSPGTAEQKRKGEEKGRVTAVGLS